MASNQAAEAPFSMGPMHRNRLAWLCSALLADDDGPMSNYHVSQCTALINNPQASADVRTIAEGLVAMANGIDDADSMVQQALERIDIVLERIQHIEKRLELLEAGL